MKSLRLWLLIVLAVLLPARGAVAAGMLCPVGNAGSGQSAFAAHAAHGSMDTTVHASAHDDVGAIHADAAADHHDPATGDTCPMCTAFCSLTPLVSEVPTLHAPLGLAAARFAALAAPPPSFVADGPERPPRTC